MIVLFSQRVLSTVFVFILVAAAALALGRGRFAYGDGPVPDVVDEQQVPVYVQADSITYDRKADIYYADGQVELKWKNLVLKADSVEMNRTTRKAVARGRVALEQGDGGRMTCDRAEMNIDDQTGLIQHGVLYFDEYNLTVSGEEIERVKQDRYYVRKATLTTCSGKTPDWRITAKEVELKADGAAKIKNATFDIRNIPVMYLPYFSYPAKSERKSGVLLPGFRSNSRIGTALSLPIYWAFHPSADATFIQTYFSRRGYQQGVEVRYAPLENLEGSFQAEFLQDQAEVDEKVDYRGGVPRTEEDRWRVRMNQRAGLPLGIVSRTHVDIVSDNYYLEDFSADQDERYLRYLTSTVNMTKRQPSYLVAGELEYYRNLDALEDSNDRTIQKLPTLMFYRTQVPFMNFPLAVGWDTQVDHFWREDGVTGEVLSLNPRLSLPIRMGPYFSLIPFASWDEKVFMTQGDPEYDDQGRVAGYHAGVSLSTEFARKYGVQGKGNAWRFKHTIQPELRFDVVENVAEDDFPEEFFDVPEEDRTLSAVLTQFLTKKSSGPRGDVTIRELGRLRITQPYSIDEASGGGTGPGGEKQPFRPLRADLELRLYGDPKKHRTSSAHWGPEPNPNWYLYFDFEGAFDWYDREWADLTARIRGGDTRGDQLAISYERRELSSLDSVSRKQVDGNLRIRTFPFVNLTAHARYDQDEERFIRFGYGIEFYPSCWAIHFRHTVEPGFLGVETDHTFWVKFLLRGMGERFM